MASQWLINRNGVQSGPFSSQQLRELASSGQIGPEDLIWKTGMKEWAVARTAKGLLPAKVQAPDPPPSSTSLPDSQNGQAAEDSTPPSNAGRIALLIGVLLTLFFFRDWLPARHRRARRENVVATAKPDPPRREETPKLEPAAPSLPPPSQPRLVLTKGQSPEDAPALSEDYLPIRQGTSTFIDTFHDARTGERLLAWKAVVTPKDDGYESFQKEIYPPDLEHITQTTQICLTKDSQAVWYGPCESLEPLVYLGATQGDKWTDGKELVFEVIGFRGLDNEEVEILETHLNNKRDSGGNVTVIVETITLRRGSGVIRREWKSVTNGKPWPHPDRVIQRTE